MSYAAGALGFACMVGRASVSDAMRLSGIHVAGFVDKASGMRSTICAEPSPVVISRLQVRSCPIGAALKPIAVQGMASSMR